MREFKAGQGFLKLKRLIQIFKIGMIQLFGKLCCCIGLHNTVFNILPPSRSLQYVNEVVESVRPSVWMTSPLSLQSGY